MRMNKLPPPPLPITKRYVLRLFISLKHITASVTDRSTGRVAESASSVEKALKDGMDSAAVGEVLAMRLKVGGLHREPICANPAKEAEKKGLEIVSKVRAVFDAVQSHGVNLRLDSNERDPPR